MAREGRAALGLGDRLILLVAWLATCGLVYLLGFSVGKGAQERRLGHEERIVRLPVTSQPPPEGQRPKTEEFVFYDKLMGERPGEASARPATQEPAPAPTEAVERPGRPDAPKPTSPAPPVATAKPPPPVVATAKPPPPVVATAKPPPPTPAPTPAPVPAKPPAAVIVPAKTPPAIANPIPHPATAAAPPPATEKVSAPAQMGEKHVAAVAPPASTPAGAPSAPPAARPAGGSWTVLANPSRNRDEADDLLYQLKARGYDATLVRVLRDGDTWYRVQVGRFSSAEQANEMMRRLREHEGITHAFVASE
jgi:hypothetical protein